MKRLHRPGLYEDLLTSALDRDVAAREQEGWWIDVQAADATARPEFLARHVYELLRRALEGIPGDDGSQAAAQISMVNRLVEVPFEHGALTDDRVATAARLLLEAVERPSLGGTPSPAPRPTLSLRRTGLLVNGRRDVQIASEITREIPSADRIDLLCAFVRHSGLRLFRSELEARVREGAQVRVIASVYAGSTKRRALDALVALGARVKVSYEVARTRLHAKAWLFHRDSGLHTAYIGSSNLTQTAQIEGLEWNVRVSAAENPEVIERFEATFEQYWQEPEFEDYEPEGVAADEGAAAQTRARLHREPADTIPGPWQSHPEASLEDIGGNLTLA
ncbi:MAG: phospholipase D-like domain-containing protein [Rhodospirillales bacterium]|nr:phospholipase D-like domain-containing protein [Rhodospirillales bacterium]